MIILYIDEVDQYSETFVREEKKYIQEKSIEVQTLYLKNLKIDRLFFSNFLASIANIGLYIDIFFILIYSANNLNRLRSNLHAILLVISNIHLLKSYSNIDHIRAHFLAKRSTFALLTSRILKVPFSTVAHAADIFDWDNSILYKMEKAEFVHAISNYNIGYLNAKSNFKFANKISLIRNSFDVNNFHDSLINKQHDQITFTIVARLIDKKGIMEFLKIFQTYYVNYNQNSKLNIIGSGPLLKKIETYIFQNNLSNVVKIHGVLQSQDVSKVLMKSSFLVLLSKNATLKDRDMDGLPTVFFEALNIGLPVISTEVSGIPELLLDGVNSIILDLNITSVDTAYIMHNKILDYDFDYEKIKNDFQLFLINRYGGKILLDRLRKDKLS